MDSFYFIVADFHHTEPRLLACELLQWTRSWAAGGFGATGVLFSAYLICLPGNVWGSVALYISLFFTSLTVFIELPIAIWTLITREVAPVEIPFISRNPLVEKISGGLANMRRKLGSAPRT